MGNCIYEQAPKTGLIQRISLGRDKAHTYDIHQYYSIVVEVVNMASSQKSIRLMIEVLGPIPKLRIRITAVDVAVAVA